MGPRISIKESVCPSIGPSVRLSVRPLVGPSVGRSVHLSVRNSKGTGHPGQEVVSDSLALLSGLL